MTADNITAQRLADLLAALETAARSIDALYWDDRRGNLDPAEAAAIVNETIQNLTNEAR